MPSYDRNIPKNGGRVTSYCLIKKSWNNSDNLFVHEKDVVIVNHPSFPSLGA